MRRTRLLIPTTALIVGLVLTGCSGQDAQESPSAETPSSDQSASPGPGETGAEAPAEPAVVVQGLEAPWSVTFVQDTALVSERDSGRVLEIMVDGGTREIGTVPGVRAGSEGGLLGLAVRDAQLYAYSTGEESNRIHRFALQGGPGQLSLGEPELVLDGIPRAGNHNGGRIAFGPDGMLYATTGDAGQRDAAQDRESLAGKILRMTPDGEVPEDNPFEGSLVYSSGHRNPQGLAWGLDGTLYASEFGQNTWDELNVIEPGANYGWPEVEGSAGREGFTDPVQQWAPAEASPSGIAVHGDSLWIAALRGSRLIEVPLDDLGSSNEHWVDEHGRLRDAVSTPDGELWVLTNNTDGRGSPGPQDDRLLRFGE